MKIIITFLLACILCYHIYGQCPAGTSPVGSELVVNGDFESGNIDFSSGYNYKTPPNTTEGQYWVSTGASSWNGAMASNGDHTSGTGNFLLVNGDPTANISIWCQTVSVMPHTDYSFSAWVSTLYTTNPAILQVSINGVAVGATATAPSSTDTWSLFQAAWNSGTDTSASICIVNKNTAVIGNDFGLDDISFKQCSCSLHSKAGTVSPAVDSVCAGGTINFVTTGSTGNLQWQSSTDGVIFTDIQGSTNSNYNANGILNITYYRVIAGTNCDGDSSSVSTISIISPFVVGTIKATPPAACSGDSVVLSVSGCSGVIQWQSSTDSLHYSNAPGGDSVFTASLLSKTVWFRVKLSNTCGVDTSLVMKVPVTAMPDAGVLSSSKDTICPGTLTRISLSGASGMFAWQSSDNIWGPFVNLAADSNLNSIEPQLYQTTYYRIVSANGACLDSSSVFSIIVSPAPVAKFSFNSNAHDVSFKSDSSEAVNSWLWDFDDTTYSNQPDPTHTFDTTGTFHVCLTVTNKTKCSFTLCRNVTILPSAVKDIISGDEWSVFPNPVTDNIYLSNKGISKIEKISLYDVTGRVVYYETGIPISTTIKITLAQLTKGIYILNIITGNGNYSYPLIKQ